MTKEFVIITKAEFEAWATTQFGEGQFQLTVPKQGIELVIRYELPIHGFEIHVYTTVVPERQQSRGCGEDAIRFILFDRYAAKPVAMASKVLRVQGDTSVWERCSQRIAELLLVAKNYEKNNWFCNCVSQRSHTVERKNQKNGSVFRGCAFFPKCKNSNRIQVQEELYPLRYNPFQTSGILGVTTDAEVDYPPVVDAATFVQAEVCPTKEFNNAHTYPICEEGNCVSTDRFPILGYQFSQFNRVQSTVIRSHIPFSDTNLVLGTATSSGKTICAVLAIAAALDMINEEVNNVSD